MPLRIVSTDPLNAEAPLSAIGMSTTPVAEFYIRNNFAVPSLDADTWRLGVHGRVLRPLELRLSELQSLPRRTRRVTLECAGNGRALLKPVADGTPWGLGAVGTADFTGVALRDVLELARVDDDVVEFVFSGADAGDVPRAGRVPFQRSLPREIARSSAPLLAWAMNDEPLTAVHGHPVRLIVPGYYAVASVKWLIGIEAVDRPFRGHFQTDRYMYRRDGAPARPVTWMRVRSLITSHRDGERVVAGRVILEGVAWSGHGAIRMVELQVGPRAAWRLAELHSVDDPAAATRWTGTLALSPGTHCIRVRATDETGATQPDEPEWNELGYGNNVIHGITLRVIEGPAPLR